MLVHKVGLNFQFELFAYDLPQLSLLSKVTFVSLNLPQVFCAPPLIGTVSLEFRPVSATSKLLRRRQKGVTDVDFYVVVGDKEPEPEQVSCRRRG